MFILHNSLRGVDPNVDLLAQVDAKLINNNDVHEDVSNKILEEES